MANAQPKTFRPGEGRTYRLGQVTLVFKSVADDEPGIYSVCETTSHPGSGAGPHRYTAYEETHIVIEGKYEVQLGDEMLKLGPGEMAFMLNGVPHSRKNLAPGSGRQLVISSPPGVFEAFIAEVVASQIDSGSPSRPGGAHDFKAIAAKHGVKCIDAPR